MSEAPDFRAPTRDSAIPRFYVKPVQNSFETERQGHPVFHDVEYVEINVPGDRTAVVDCAVRDEHRKRWPEAYRAFKDGQDVPVTGFPLKEWAGVTRSQAEELSHFKIRTVEQLAELPDDALGRVVAMGGFALRQKARDHLAAAAGAAPTDALRAENAELKATLKAFEERLKAMETQSSEEPATRGPGRPRKVAEA